MQRNHNFFLDSEGHDRALFGRDLGIWKASKWIFAHYFISVSVAHLNRNVKYKQIAEDIDFSFSGGHSCA